MHTLVNVVMVGEILVDTVWKYDGSSFLTVNDFAESKNVRDQIIEAKNKFGMIFNLGRLRHSAFPDSGNLDFVLKGSDE